MLDDEDRKGAVDYVVEMLIEKGKLGFALSGMQRYGLPLPYCSVGVLTSSQEGFLPVVEIAEHFCELGFMPEGKRYAYFDGIRTLYRGDRNGLYEVVLQGIFMPNAEGKTLSPVEIMMRTMECPGKGELTVTDVKRFDAFLKYAERHLQDY